MGMVLLPEEVGIAWGMGLCGLHARWLVDLYQKGLKLIRKKESLMCKVQHALGSTY